MPTYTQSIQMADGVRLRLAHWLAQQPEIRAVVMVVHGLGEHIRRYEHVAKALAVEGYRVVGLDLRGHGDSEGKPRAYVSDIDCLVDDLDVVTDKILTTQGTPRLFLIGHSMGGVLALRLALRQPEKIAGVITSGAALALGAGIPAPVIRFGKLVARLTPKMPLIRLNTSLISRDMTIVDLYKQDLLCYQGRVRAGIGFSLVMRGQQTLEAAQQLTPPLLIMHGSADKITVPAYSERLYESAGAGDKTLKIFPGLYHEIFNEPEKREVLKTVVKWLHAHT